MAKRVKDKFKQAYPMLRELQDELAGIFRKTVEEHRYTEALQDGDYRIAMAYGGISEIGAGVSMTVAGDTAEIKTALVDHACRRMSLVLEKGNEIHCLSFDGDIYSLDLLGDLVGKTLFARDGNLTIEGGRCNIGLGDEFGRMNLISPKNYAAASYRGNSSDMLGLGGLEAIMPHTMYKIAGVTERQEIDNGSHTLRYLIEIALDRVAPGDFIVAREGLGRTHGSRLNLRAYFPRGAEPDKDRTEKFFKERVNRQFITAGGVPTVVMPRSVNWFLSNFTALNETPLMEACKVYAIDGVAQTNETELYLVYYPVELHRKIQAAYNRAGAGLCNVITITGYRKNAGADTPYHIRRCRADSISAYFDRINLSQDPDRKWVFTVTEDIYHGMLDYMHTPSGPSPHDLFQFSLINVNDRESIERVRSMALKRRSQRITGMRGYNTIDSLRG